MRHVRKHVSWRRGAGQRRAVQHRPPAHLSRGVTEISGGRARKMPRGPGNMRQKLNSVTCAQQRAGKLKIYMHRAGKCIIGRLDKRATIYLRFRGTTRLVEQISLFLQQRLQLDVGLMDSFGA